MEFAAPVGWADIYISETSIHLSSCYSTANAATDLLVFYELSDIPVFGDIPRCQGTMELSLER